MAKKRGDGANKSQAIRDYQTAHPEAKPQEIAAALKEQGFDVTPGYVSTIRSLDKKKTGKKAGRGRPAAAAVAAPSGEGLSIATLLTAKKLATQLGGIANAKAAIDALARLGL